MVSASERTQTQEYQVTYHYGPARTGCHPGGIATCSARLPGVPALKHIKELEELLARRHGTATARVLEMEPTEDLPDA